MKKTNFLSKLEKEGTLRIIPPNDDLTNAYIQKSKSNLSSAKLLSEHHHHAEAVSMAYYTMYNMLIALLFKTGIKCENHTGSILLLHEVFNIDNEDISFAKKERIDKQYYVDFSISNRETHASIKSAEIFSNNIYNYLATMNNENILHHRQIIKSILNK